MILRKHFTLTLLLVFVSSFGQFLFAQSTQYEVGLRLNDFNSFGMIYKKEKAPDKFKRIRLALANANIASTNTSGELVFTYNLALAYGIEKRVKLDPKIQFFHGYEPFTSFSLSNLEDRSAGTFRLGLGYVLGINYALSDALDIGFETIPSIRYSQSFTSMRETNEAFGIGFNSQVAALSITLKFNKKAESSE